MEQREYVDVRGVWPLYVRGPMAVELRDQPRSITVEDARVLAEKMLKE